MRDEAPRTGHVVGEGGYFFGAVANKIDSPSHVDLEAFVLRCLENNLPCAREWRGTLILLDFDAPSTSGSFAGGELGQKVVTAAMEGEVVSAVVPEVRVTVQCADRNRFVALRSAVAVLAGAVVRGRAGSEGSTAWIAHRTALGAGAPWSACGATRVTGPLRLADAAVSGAGAVTAACCAWVRALRRNGNPTRVGADSRCFAAGEGGDKGDLVQKGCGQDGDGLSQDAVGPLRDGDLIPSERCRGRSTADNRWLLGEPDAGAHNALVCGEGIKRHDHVVLVVGHIGGDGRNHPVGKAERHLLRLEAAAVRSVDGGRQGGGGCGCKSHNYRSRRGGQRERSRRRQGWG